MIQKPRILVQISTMVSWGMIILSKLFNTAELHISHLYNRYRNTCPANFILYASSNMNSHERQHIIPSLKPNLGLVKVTGQRGVQGLEAGVKGVGQSCQYMQMGSLGQWRTAR